MSDRAQIAALGERFERERPRMAFDGCMGMHFERHPPDHALRSAASALVKSLPSLMAMQRVLAKFGGGK